MADTEITTLADGAQIAIRPVQPADKEGIADGFDRLSARSRYRRFFAPLEHLTPADLRYLTELDHHRHEALIAYEVESGQSLGVARFVLTDDPRYAEVAVTVVDDWQHRGVASALLERLVVRAREEGVTHFVALILDENDDALALYRGLAPDGGEPRRSASGHLELVIELPAPGEPFGETRLGEALRETAEHKLTINPWRVLKRHLQFRGD